MAKKTPPYTQMTLKWLRDQGYHAEVVERFISRGTGEDAWEGGKDGEGGKKKAIFGFRKDFLGFIDIIAFSPHETIGVQATSQAQRSQHIRKIKANDNLPYWLCGPARKVLLITWSKKLVKRGGKAKRWHPTLTEITEGCAPF